MATRIEFHKHGGPEVLQTVEFTPTEPAEHEIGLRTKPLVSTSSTPISVADSIRPRRCLRAREPKLRVWSVKLATAWSTFASAIASSTRSQRSALTVPSITSPQIKPRFYLTPFPSNRRQPLSQGIDRFYLLRKTYEVKPDEPFLFHAAAGGVGLIACQWAKALGAKLIGTVGSAQSAAGAGRRRPQVINYREESIVERVKEITGGKKSAWSMTPWGKIPEASLDCLQRRGLMVSFGNASGPVTGVNLGILNQKGSCMPRDLHYRGILRRVKN